MGWTLVAVGALLLLLAMFLMADGEDLAGAAVLCVAYPCFVIVRRIDKRHVVRAAELKRQANDEQR
jgi:hypothetical protein